MITTLSDPPSPLGVSWFMDDSKCFSHYFITQITFRNSSYFCGVSFCKNYQRQLIYGWPLSHEPSIFFVICIYMPCNTSQYPWWEKKTMVNKLFNVFCMQKIHTRLFFTFGYVSVCRLWTPPIFCTSSKLFMNVQDLKFLCHRPIIKECLHIPPSSF